MTNSHFHLPKPNMRLPESMKGLDPDSWAFHTITRRWPEITRRMFAENDLTKSSMQNLEALIADIPDGTIRPIKDPGAPDTHVWNQDIRVHAGKNWLEPPWFFTEHYFYRRVIEAIGYFQFVKGEGIDPFAFQKHQGLAVNQDSIRALIKHVAELKDVGNDRDTLILLLYLDLWGNQADLSMWPAEGDTKPDHRDVDQTSDFLLEDHAEEVADFIVDCSNIPKQPEGLRIDFIIDNAGFELVSDLLITDYLLSSGMATNVRLHVKPHPTYVSDAMVKDVSDTLDFLKTDSDDQVNALGSRLSDFWEQGRLQVRDNFFWTSPLQGWDMPYPLVRELSQSNLVVSKGDANYRRLLGDLDWPKTTLFSDILEYFPTPLVALRTVKAEIACGMKPGQAEHVAEKDPDWMIDGRWGVVQFANKKMHDG